MNLMRKLRTGSMTGANGSDASCNTHHLGLMHLKKLFTEYLHLSQVLTDREHEDKLYNMLPLFCKVFGASAWSDMSDKFRDVAQFCERVSKLMVSEIRRRASNQSTETASCAIAKFLEIENCEESSNGWMLLSTLNLLAAGDASLIQVMTTASLPSTLVKCLYLFFDLPDLMNPDVTDQNSEFTPRERRILLQKIFVQLLVRLCSHTGPSEELSKKNDLSLLFSAITSWCPSHNHIWRKSAAEVLMTISRHGLTTSVVTYIHNKGCVGLCIENMQRGQDLSPLEIVEMFVAVFCFLKDSSEVSSSLLEDFRINHGYTFLSDFLLKLERDSNDESVEAMRNLVLMIASLSMCGQTELKPSPASMGSLFQMLGFSLPQPSASGSSVRNIQAFLVLQYVFLKSNSASLCCTILDAISSVYHADNANYFILENQHTLPQFCEKIHLKPTEIQEKFFQLLEFIVFQLNFVPCKELIALSILLKSQGSVSCSIICMHTLLNILRHNVIFKDVYREVGLLEVFVGCFTVFASSIKQSSEQQPPGEVNKDEEKLGFLVMEALTHLISGNSSNASLLRTSGGAKTVHSLVQLVECRQQALSMLRELILSGGGEEDLATLLAMMHSAPADSLTLKLHILKCVVQCLRESHKTRNVFRKVGGFVYVLSVLVSMESCLVDEPNSPWDECTPSQLLTLLHAVFNTVTVAMRFEPANAKFFHQEICLTSLCDTLRLLGCFSQNTQIDECEEVLTFSLEDTTFHYLFVGNLIEPDLPENLPKQLCYACLVLRLLYDVAVDAYDKPSQSLHSIKSPSHKRQLESQISGESPSGSKRVSSLNLTPPSPDPLVVHPGVVIAMFHLLPSIFSSKYPQLSLRLQVYCAEVVKSLMRSERNQQVMCEAGLPAELLTVGRLPLQDESHPLHSPLQYMIERLATQSLQPKDLRELLRLGSPLFCGDSVAGGGSVPLTRVKTLVSMTTPRGPLLSPPFTEFDMSAEGFGCLYLPSISPQSSSTTVSALAVPDDSVIGGIGAGDRLFPPVTGLSYSSWICIERYSEARTDPHPVRLLTLVRTSSKDQHIVCLVLLLSARDKSILVSTMETPLSQVTSDWEPEVGSDWTARVWCPDLLQEGHWHHILLVLNRAVLKNSSLSLYVDGQHLHTQKLHYISQNPGGGAANLSIASSVYGYIGTPPGWRRYSRLAWKQGPCHLVEEVLPPHTLHIIYQLGPHYLASLQSPQLIVGEVLSALVSEEKIMFGLNAKAVSHLTLLKIRKVYSRVDNKSIAKQLGMPSYENATPIRVLHNSAGHLSGMARSLGGVVVGYLGVRVFTPQPVASMIHSVGGASLLLGLISMAADVESLYAGVKALVCVVRSDRACQSEMDRLHGYQTLAMLLRKKKHILNSHILHLVFSLVGTVDSSSQTSTIPNTVAFQDLLCNIEVWHEAPGDLQRSLFEHLYELVAESNEKKTNVTIMRQMNLVQRLLYVLPQITSNPTRTLILNLLGALLVAHPSPQDLLSFGQFVVSMLPYGSLCERNLILPDSDSDLQDRTPVDRIGNLQDRTPADRVANILLRNRCLQLLHSLLFTPRNTVNIMLCEEVSSCLGLDYPLLFLQSHLHPTTVVWAMRIVVVLCSVPTLLNKFREGTCTGSWLQDTELLLHNKQGVVLAGCQLGGAIPKKDCKLDSGEKIGLPGFQQLGWLLQHHADIPQIYFLLMALMMGQTAKHLPHDSKLDLVNAWSLLFGVPANQTMSSVMSKISLCPEAITLMLALVRVLLSSHCKVWDTDSEDRVHYAVNIIQFLLLVYNSSPHMMPVFMGQEVLTALSNTLFPLLSQPSTPAPDEVFESDERHGPISPKETIGSHPAHKFVMDFLRFIIMDSLSLPIAAKSTPPLDIVIECCGENGSLEEQSKFQTEVLSSLMEHIQETSMLLGDQSCLPVAQGGNAANIAPNVSYLTSRTVDKLWQGCLAKDGHEVFEFVVKLLTQAKRRQTCQEALYHCLNRTILYLLSRGTDSITEQMSVLEALHKLTHHRALIFGAGNHELDFIGCLVYCLLQFASDMKIQLDVNTKTTWHINPQSDSEDELTSRQGQNLISVAARRVWEELYVCKKPAIEEVFKTSLGSSKAPELCSLRDQLYDVATKMWVTYLEQERRAFYKNPWEMHNQIQSKIQKVTGGLSRLASRSKVKKEESLRVKSQMSGSENDMVSSVSQHISLVRELVELQAKQHMTTQHYLERYVLEEWTQAEFQLTRERAIWGPLLPSRLDKWMLDMTEGPCRMRKKMMRNEIFYLHYPYRPELESGDNKSLKYKVATSWDSKDYYQKFKGQIPLDRDCVSLSTRTLSGSSERSSIDDMEDPDSLTPGLYLEHCPIRRAVKRSVSEPDDPSEDMEMDNSGLGEDDSAPDNQTILRILEHNEKISHMFRCARIQGLDTVEGLLLFGKEHLYIVDGFTLIKSREIRDIDSVPQDMYEPILPSQGASPSTKRHCSKFCYDDIREVHKRRYLLQPMALEVFLGDGRNYLLAFPRKIRNKVYQRFMAFATGISDSAQQSVAGQKRTANVEQAASILSSLMGETSVTQRWVRGEITNFQYLMHLNTLAGRSYNDLMQYPVFPWILSDYDSERLDLTRPSTFRDFTKPMGAQTNDRLLQFRKRYKEWDDPHGETPPYHYGTHYSSAMIVCSYLVRMEPFTQHFLRLQGGHFDLADRMFHSIKEAWLSASKHNMADVKELVPEFFYLPEFLANANNFDLGCKQNGVELGDVVLPPWAKSDPREFIRLHREALESDYVSQNLHHWIDLIFGYKQQGQPAIEAVNVFHHLFYEGNVDIYSIDDPLKKNATIGFINNFGQIPKQLFKKAHPCKKMNQRVSVLDPSSLTGPSVTLAPDRLFYHNLDSLRPSLHPIKELKGPVGEVLQFEKSILAVEQNKVLVPPNWSRYIAWGFADHTLRIGNYDSDRAIATCESVAHTTGEVTACVCPSTNVIITAGTSSVVTIWEYKKKCLRVVETLVGHREAVTCLAASSAYNVILSGSRDTTAILWDLSRRTFVRQLRTHIAPIAAVNINNLTGDIATCAGTWLHVWTINGEELCRVNTCVGGADRMQQILCVQFSECREWDTHNVILTGSTDGVVRMWSIDYVQVPKEEDLPPVDQTEVVETNSKVKSKVSIEETQVKTRVRNELAKQMSISAELVIDPEKGLIVKSGSESSLSGGEEDGTGHKKKQPDSQPEEKEKCSCDEQNTDTDANSESISKPEVELKEDSSLEQAEPPQVVVRRRRSSAKNPLIRKSECGGLDSLSLPDDGMSKLRSSKSETCLTDSFIVIGSDGEEIDHRHHCLRQGFKWQRQLVFRSKLTMHTAYDRKDNTEPASITALAVSKDQRTVYVGDARGRVFSWTVADGSGRADHWLKDDGAEACTACQVKFSLYERRHHCRNCGLLFCSKCSRFESEISRLRILKPVRVCQSCHVFLHSNQNSKA